MPFDYNHTSNHDREVRVSILEAAKTLKIEKRTIQPPGPSEVQVSVRSTGLCGSDLHYYKHFRNGDILVKEPLCLGHESAGVVADVGSAVTDLKVGDKVALEVGLPCGECDRCGEGRYNLCKEMRFRASARRFPHDQGTLQDRINQPAAWCHKLPDHVSLELGALLEPLSVAIHATRRASLSPNSTFLVLGAGAVGLLTAATAKLSGASDVIIADIDQGRVDFAVENGFAHCGYTVPLKRGSSVEEDLSISREVATAIGRVSKTSTGQDIGEVDVTFECTGVPSCSQTAIYATRPGGKVMLVGMGNPVQTLPISAATVREIDLLGVFRYANTYPAAIEVASRSPDDVTPDLRKLITHRYQGLENAEKAFEMAGKTKDEEGKLVLKVMINTTGDQ